MHKFPDKLQKQLDKREDGQQLRSLPLPKGGVDFYSNDYLGLSKKTFDISSIDSNGATGSRLLSGNSTLYTQTEGYLASLFESEATLIFNSGYNANLSILSAIPQKEDLILFDQKIHSSLKDGHRLSFAKALSFKHNSIDNLRQKLNTYRDSYDQVYIVVESIYSMDGDFCPLEDIVQLCKEYDAHCILDEAHSTAIMGPHGTGYAQKLNLHHDIFARVHTFGKGLGAHGASISGSTALITYLINFARAFIYTTALPQHSLKVILSAFKLLEHDNSLANKLDQKIALYVDEAKKLGLAYKPNSPIQMVQTGNPITAKTLSKQLQQEGFITLPIIPPTVPKGEEGIRICIHNYNTEKEIKTLLSHCAQFTRDI